MIIENSINMTNAKSVDINEANTLKFSHTFQKIL